MYDMVQIEKAVDATEGGILTDWFEGRMIPQTNGTLITLNVHLSYFLGTIKKSNLTVQK